MYLGHWTFVRSVSSVEACLRDGRGEACGSGPPREGHGWGGCSAPVVGG